jgi:hypothetical protein
MSDPVLVLSAGLAAEPGLPELEQRLRRRSARSVVLDAPATPRVLLAAVRGADAARSWFATREASEVGAAATAGLVGVVLVGITGQDRDEGVLVRHAPDLAGVTIAMVPRGGGCWHGGP